MEVVNPIGAGICLAAGIANWPKRGGDELPEAVKYGMAAAADNVRQLLPARLDPQRVDELRMQINKAHRHRRNQFARPSEPWGLSPR